MKTQEPLEETEEITLKPYRMTTASNDKSGEDESHLHLLPAHDDDDDGDDENIVSGPMTKAQVWNLYTTHILSTWNARSFEFAAVRPSTQEYGLHYLVLTVEN